MNTTNNQAQEKAPLEEGLINHNFDSQYDLQEQNSISLQQQQNQNQMHTIAIQTEESYLQQQLRGQMNSKPLMQPGNQAQTIIRSVGETQTHWDTNPVQQPQNQSRKPPARFQDLSQSRSPSLFKCTYCQYEGYSLTVAKAGDGTMCAVCCLCFFGLICALVPLLADDCKDIHHQCPQCRRVVGVSQYHCCD